MIRTLRIGLLYALILSLPLLAQALDLPPKNVPITNNLGKELASDAVKEVVSIYKSEGIEPALEQASASYAQLKAIRGNRYLREADFRAPYIHMGSRMWREAQVYTGVTDPEWGLAVFRWYAKQKKASLDEGGGVYRNIYNCLYALGRLGEAHLLILRMEDVLNENGLQTNPKELEDLGPWHMEFPKLRNRPLPTRFTGSKDLTLPYDTYMQYLMLNTIAWHAYSEGDWRRAAELAISGMKFAKLCVERVADGQQKVHARVLYESYADILADILEFVGEYRVAHEFLDETLALNFDTYSGRYRDFMLLGRESLLIELGRNDPESIARAGKVMERSLVNKHINIPKLAWMVTKYASILEHHGRSGEAWEYIEAFEQNIKDNNLASFHALRLGKIKLALRTNQLKNVEQWLLESLEYVRHRGLKIDEPELYELYANYMAAIQRPVEAARLMREAKRLYRGLDIEHSYQRASTLLADYQSIADDSVGTHEMIAEVDLQPLEMSSDALPGQSAYGRFALINPTTKAVSGQFSANGKIEAILWHDTSQTLTIVVDDRFAARKASRKLELHPNEQILIDTVAKHPGSDPSTLHLLFKAEAQPYLKSKWNYSSSPESVTKAFINASSVQDNPFYLVPIFHTLQRNSSEVNPITNFRFIASADMRIEVYDSITSQLIFIDANGDGDLMDAGDQLTQDRDRDGQSDHVYENDLLTADIEVYFHVPKFESDDTIELSLQIKEEDQWVTQCVNLIRVNSETTVTPPSLTN